MGGHYLVYRLVLTSRLTKDLDTITVTPPEICGDGCGKYIHHLGYLQATVSRMSTSRNLGCR